jgi:hypothetical protein
MDVTELSLSTLPEKSSMSTQKTLTMETVKETENRVDRAMERIRKCAAEMSITITEDELTRFALIYCGMIDDARELIKTKLGGEFVLKT